MKSSQEIEDRLRRTLSEDKTEIDLYGSKQNAAIVRLIGLVIQAASAKEKHDWLKEQWLFVMLCLQFDTCFCGLGPAAIAAYGR